MMLAPNGGMLAIGPARRKIETRVHRTDTASGLDVFVFRRRLQRRPNLAAD